MKKTLNIDEKLLKKAREESGAKTDTETIRLGLQELVRRAAYARMLAYREPDAQDVPRRREEPMEQVGEQEGIEKMLENFGNKRRTA